MGSHLEMGSSSAEMPDEVKTLVYEALRSLKADPSSAERCIADAVERLTRVVDPSRRCPSGGLAPWQIIRVKAEIQARLGDRVSISHLATTVRLSPSHFARAFRESFHTSPHSFLTRARIEQAKAMMTSTDWPLSDIALACGLADQAHLSRTFRKLEGESPAAWRKMNRNPDNIGRTGAPGHQYFPMARYGAG